MPALITHDFFGQDVYDRLFRDIGGTRDEAEAFLLGNQGPDPLFYAVADPRLHEHNRLGNVMHSEKPSELIKAFKDSLGILDDDELPVGRAYAFGFLCHYTLDSTLHPLVFFHEYRLTDAGEPGLSRDDAHEVHAVIETELDELVLTAKRGETVATYHPATSVLRGRDSMLDTVGRLYAGAVDDAFGLTMPKTMFKSAVRAERAAQRALYSPTGAKRAVLSAAERLVRPHAMTGAMSHRAAERATSAFANGERAPWRHPATEAVSRASFWDLYDQARAGALDAIKAMDADDFDLAASHRLTADVNFYGEPVVALVVAVEDAAAGDDVPDVRNR